jgi:hypothetical protein
MPQTMATVVSEITTSLYTVASLHGGTFAISAEHESGLTTAFFRSPSELPHFRIPEAWKYMRSAMRLGES